MFASFVHKFFTKSHIKCKGDCEKKGAFLMRKGVFLLLIMTIFILASCSGKDAVEQLDYDQTKKMIVDILKTDDGKKAIREIMEDQDIKQKLVMDQAVVKETIEQTLTSEKGQDFWKKSFEDPKFAESVALSMKKEHEELLKNLMKDPEYQSLMIDILNNPELKDDFAKSLKSKDFRKHLQEVVTETIDSPLYKAKIQDLLLKAAEESGKGQDDKKGGGSE